MLVSLQATAPANATALAQQIATALAQAFASSVSTGPPATSAKTLFQYWI